MPRPFEESWYLRFHGLMPFRIREILLVSSPYDAFAMEEDGRLMTRLFQEYSELNLSELPTITRAHTAATAFELLAKRKFDLVITMANIADMDVPAFARKAAREFPATPRVLFAFSEAELSDIDQSSFDHAFIWTGDANVLIGALKLIEDARNLDNDTSVGVRVILVVEDSVRAYSSFLTALYAELFRQARSMVAEGVNDLHKRMRMRARPKVLLARTFEDAARDFDENRHNLLAAITDVRFPRNGRLDPEAGFRLVEHMRELDPDLPILVQSAEPEARARAHELGAAFGDKGSPHLLATIRSFLRDDLGFGDFVFRLPDRTEVGRASDIYEMELILPQIPDESIDFHAAHNHFSTWLMARGMFMEARELRPRTVAEFDNVDGLRQHLISVMRRARRQEQSGAISDFSESQPDQTFVRIGTGSIGGKGRAIAFVNSILAPQRLRSRFDDLDIQVPRSVAIGTDEFERFVDANGLSDLIDRPAPDVEVRRRFIEAPLSRSLEEQVAIACSGMDGPLAVRSSSILEDSRTRPFAGIYATYMLPNNHPDLAVRERELTRAIKAVYASTYEANARAYIANTPHTMEEERMGVVIQEVVGRPHGSRFYPDFSGVAYSYNFYPVAGQVAGEGVAAVALGLGRMVVDGGTTLQFSPRRPRILPQFPSARDFFEHGQSQFYAIDLERPTGDFIGGPTQVRLFGLRDAEADGVLAWVGSVYCPDDDTIRDNLRLPGPRVVSFQNILRWESLPLAPALDLLLDVMKSGFGHGVEIEFAVDMRPSASPVLYVLQVRPQAGGVGGAGAELPDPDPSVELCRTDVALGHGVIGGLRDIVYVKRDMKDRSTVAAAAIEVGRFNAKLLEEGRPYVLIGPGRWGSSDPRLGIPVVWSQISGAKVIVETKLEGRSVEPSQGSHFFHNVLSMQLGYLTLSLDGQRIAQLDQAWLDRQAGTELEAVRHIQLDAPMTVILDGRRGQAAILRGIPPSAA
jgi:CheY-like chemotaxis protein